MCKVIQIIKKRSIITIETTVKSQTDFGRLQLSAYTRPDRKTYEHNLAILGSLSNCYDMTHQYIRLRPPVDADSSTHVILRYWLIG